MAFLCVKTIQVNQTAATEAFQLNLSHALLEEESGFFGKIKNVASGQRVVDVEVLDKKAVIDLSDEEYQSLCRIVEAEAGCEDSTGKLLVANVVINRVKSPKFPNSVTEVVFQQEDGTTQFSPVSDGRYNQVDVSEETIEAVEKAIYGEDVSQGALYFAARSYADPERMAWFDANLTKLFTYGGHEFFL